MLSFSQIYNKTSVTLELLISRLAVGCLQKYITTLINHRVIFVVVVALGMFCCTVGPYSVILGCVHYDIDTQLRPPGLSVMKESHLRCKVNLLTLLQGYASI